MSREVRIEFLNESGLWETLSQSKVEYLSLQKDKALSGKTRAGTSTSFRAIDVDSGAILDLWHSEKP